MAADRAMTPPRSVRWALGLLAVLGVLAFVVARERDDPVERHALARGEGWRAADARGAVPEVPRSPAGGLQLAGGHGWELDAPAEGWSGWELSAVRLAEEVTLELELSGSARTWSLSLRPDEPTELRWSSRRGDGPAQTIAEHRSEDMARSAFAPFRVGVRRVGGALVTSFMNQEVLRVPDVGEGELRPSLRVHGGPLRLLSMRLSGEAGVLLDERFDALPAVSRLPRVTTSLAWALALVGLVAAWLGALAPGGARLGALLAGVLKALAWPSLALGVGLFVDVPWIWALAGALLLLGVALARPRVDAERGPDGSLGAGDGAHAPAKSERMGCLAFGLLAGLLALGALDRQHAARLAPLVEAAHQALDGTLSSETRRVASAALDAANAVVLAGPYRDLRLSARVHLSAEGLLEARLRAPDARYAHGLALLLPAAPDRTAVEGARWMLERVAVFEPVGPEGAHAPAETWFDLTVEARGSDFVAWAERDGQRQVLARGATWEQPAGDIVLLAAKGRVGLQEVVVEPLDSSASLVGDAGRRGSLALLASLVVLWVLLAGGLLGLTWWRGLEAAGLGLLPLVVVLRWSSTTATLPAGLVAAAAAATTAWLLVHASAHGRRGAWWRRGLAAATVLLASTLAFGAVVERPVPREAREVNQLGWTARGETVADWGRPHLEHPYTRRWNRHLADHRLRGRRFELAKPENTRRVVCLGGSSTWGYRLPLGSDLDYPRRLEERLNQSTQGTPSSRVEVLNGAVLASTAARQLVFLRDVLLAFEPDVVVASFFYNDAFALSRADELDKVLAPDEHRPVALPWPLGRLASADTWENLAGNRRLRRLMADFREGVPADQLWPASAGPSPPARFETALTALAELCEVHDVDLVLVFEPLEGDRPFLWKDGFRAGMERVAGRFELPFVDPLPALQAAGDDLYMDQVHLTPEGHEVMAGVLEPIVAGLLRGRP